MKRKLRLLLMGIIPVLVSCASRPVGLAPVGPSPFTGGVASGSTGCLRVFSEREPVIEGDTPIYYQHSDYAVFNARGKLIKYVDNTNGHYETSPRDVPLPPGRYVVRARAKDYLSVEVPVVVQAGRTTSVHLDDRWRPPPSTPRTEFVFEPGGQPVGWSAEPSGK